MLVMSCIKIQIKMQCAICLSTPDQPMTMNCCKNKFCKKCIEQWVEIRSVCPLCCSETGSQKINNLRKKISGEPFDDGSLMIEAEVKQIKQRIRFVQQRVQNKRQQFESKKSGLSLSLMNYFEKQLQEIYEFQSCIDEQVALNHRASAFEYMQLTVETIINLQNSLDTNSIGCGQEQVQFDQLEYQDQEQDDNRYQEYEMDAEKKGNLKFQKSKNGPNHINKSKAVK